MGLLLVAMALVTAGAVGTSLWFRRALERVRLNEERYRLSNYGTNDTVWDLDLTTGSVWVGEAHRTKFGNPADFTHTWKTFANRVHPDDAARVTASFRDVLKSSASTWSDEFRYWQFDGTYANVVDRGFILRDDRGRAVRMVGALTDVSPLKRAEEAIDRLRRQNELILNCAGEGIFGVDVEGNATFVNPAAAAMLGWTTHELIGTRIHERIDMQFTIFSEAVHISDEESFRRRDGSRIPVDYVSSPMLDDGGSICGLVVVFRDITERRAVEQLKSEFVATVSHELRTPLTSIRGALGLLSSGMLGVVSEKGRRMLEIAVVNTDRLTRLVNDILDIERMEHAEVAIDCGDHDAAELIASAADAMRPMAEKAHVVLETSGANTLVRADSDRVLQTLTNLIGNAIKFSPEGGVIRVSAEERGSVVCFSVDDEGRGIPDDQCHAIFERFRQVDTSDSRDKGGSGLGLAICRAIVQQHGGKIWVESAVGKGSTFFFTLPLARVSHSIPA